ncbi:MAG: hypothetical protein ACU841_16565 [Gammaproteobacteria bacterium]
MTDMKTETDSLRAFAQEIITNIQSEPKVEYHAATPETLTPDIDQLIIQCGKLAADIEKLKHYAIASLEVSEPPKIADKRIKISVLEKLEPLYNDEISKVLGDIRRDLEQLEAE